MLVTLNESNVVEIRDSWEEYAQKAKAMFTKEKDSEQSSLDNEYLNGSIAAMDSILESLGEKSSYFIEEKPGLYIFPDGPRRSYSFIKNEFPMHETAKELFNFPEGETAQENEAHHARLKEHRLPFSDYGVCDNLSEVIDKWPALESDERRFIIRGEVITRELAGRMGWRWHKHGEYIGTQTSTSEYLGDEEDIEQIICYHILEVA